MIKGFSLYHSKLPEYCSTYKLFCFFVEQKKDAKSKGKEEKSEKPDTFTEKLVAHLVKNLQVRSLMDE